MVAGEALLDLARAAVAVAPPIGVLAARLEQGLFTRAGMLPAGLAHRRRLAPVRRRPRRRDRHDSARRLRERPPRLAHPPHRRAAREHGPAPRPVSWPRGLAGLAAAAGGVAVLAQRPAAAARAPPRPRPWSGWWRSRCSDRSWPGRSPWLSALPLTALSRGPGCWPAPTPAPICAASPPSRRRSCSPSSLVCTLSSGRRCSSSRRRRRPPSAPPRTTCSRPGRPRACRPTSPLARAASPASTAASGSFATTVIVAADGTNLQHVPARAVDAATLARRARSRRHRRVPRRSRAATSLAVSTDRARQFGWRVGERVAVLLGDGTPITLPRRRDLRPPAGIRRHPPATRAGRSSRHTGAG